MEGEDLSRFPLHLRAPVGWTIACLAVLTLAGPLSPAAYAQKLVDKSKPRNHPIQCVYCGGNPELMEAAGIFSHGGFEFGKTDTKGLDAFLATSDIRWIETEQKRPSANPAPKGWPQAFPEEEQADVKRGHQQWSNGRRWPMGWWCGKSR